jgi:16S rRNA A1518/A1519 N6-dimethyltransferase RsmA/KsgA/DIM1 with predicted DNA glycosylase/AP lyase activity
MRYTGPNSLGQHKLVNIAVIEQIIREADLVKTEKVLEIGSGEGTLTSHLCMKAGQVISIEIDKVKFEFAKQKLAHYKNLLLLNMDPFGQASTSFEFDVFVSNIPYSRSKESILWLINQEFNRAIIMVQKEFARKLSSTPGNRSYRAISVICEYCFNVKELFEVTNDSFSPQPTVSSVVIKLVPSGQKLSYDTIKNIALLFSQKKRNVHKVSSSLGLGPSLDYSKRICQLSPNEIVSMARNISISEVRKS